MDSTWFPFDEQRCHLVYELWKYPAYQVSLTTHGKPTSSQHFKPNDQWELLGKSFLSRYNANDVCMCFDKI